MQSVVVLRRTLLARRPAMLHPMSVTFLGTSSGGGPTENRNCSSLVCDLVPGGHLWMVDCAEGTTRQFALHPQKQDPTAPKLKQVNKLFVTHMHPDHIMGIPTLLRNVLYPPPVDMPPSVSNAIASRKPPSIEIYGPAGLRSFIRQNLKMTFSRTSGNYVVHELLTKDDQVTPCNPPSDESDPSSGSDFREWDVLHCNEVPGRDIRAGQDGLWQEVSSAATSKHDAQVVTRAGPILHREPCIGYVFEETTWPQRKVVILGDTYDPSPIIPLCSNPRPSLLIHEATDSVVSPGADKHARLSKRTYEAVMKTTLARGHSTPTMAGEFAKRVQAQKLVLNHIGGRFPAPKIGESWAFATTIIADLESQATKAWDPPQGHAATVALDYMRVLVPNPEPDPIHFAAMPPPVINPFYPMLPPTMVGMTGMYTPGSLQGATPPTDGEGPRGQPGCLMEVISMQPRRLIGDIQVGLARPSGNNGPGGPVYNNPALRLSVTSVEAEYANNSTGSQHPSSADEEPRQSKKRKHHHRSRRSKKRH